MKPSKLAQLAINAGLSPEEYTSSILADIANLGIEALEGTESNKLAWDIEDSNGDKIVVMVLLTGQPFNTGEEDDKS